MGMARYYAKARWASEGEAQEVAPDVKAFLERMADCKCRWWDMRDVDKEGNPLPTEEIIQQQKENNARLREEFSDIFERLHIDPPKTQTEVDWMHLNYLAGLLDSPAEDKVWDFRVVENEIWFSGRVWHFADWRPLMSALKTFGAIGAGYISDEYADLYDLIEL